MNKTRKALLTVLLATGMMAAGCSESVRPDETGGQAAAAFEQGAPLQASFSDSRVAGMKGVAESDQLRLFVDDGTGAIAIVHKPSGEIWHSNPPEREDDPIASGVNKDLLSSQLKIDFYNSFGQLNSINSHSDSVVFEQIRFDPIPNGVKATYQFGTAKKSAEDLPKMLSKARFEELSGKMDKTGQRALLIAYKANKDQSVYERNDSAMQGLQLERALKAFEDAGYTEEDLLKDAEEHGISQTKPEPRIFRASVEYTLDGDSFVAKIPTADIDYPETYPVNQISLLSFFGAGGPEAEGSIFVPDGSGALIHFNNGKTRYPAYQQAVYGTDMTMNRTEDAAREQTVRLPVFGLIRETGAMLGIIEEGAAAATINADVSGRLNSYNYVYPTFYVVNKGDVTLAANEQQRSLPMFQEQPMKSDFKVRYAFLSGEAASYPGMAHYYQQYLLERGGLPQAPEQKLEETPFYLQLIGSISKKKHAAGIPYRALEPLTTFEQAKTVVERLQEREIRQIKLKYAGWFNGGLDHRVPDDIKVDGAVGGSKGMRDFARYAKEQGIGFYPDVALLTAKTGKGFDEKKEAARTLRRVPATVYPLDLALNRRDTGRSPSYIVSPRLVGGYTEAMLKDYAKLGVDGISLSDLADQLNSDYRERSQIDRTESEELSVEALNLIREASLTMMADGGNAYALPVLTDITNAPMSSSGFKIEDEEIPFYQMVVRGFIRYTGQPYNLSTYTDVHPYILKCLEYGSGVYFEWIYEPNHKVKDTEFHQLYAVNYELWLDKAAAIYGQVNEVLKRVQGEPIVSHEKLGEGVYKTVYGNGIYVIVNYGDESVTAEGRTVEAESYITGGEQ